MIILKNIFLSFLHLIKYILIIDCYVCIPKKGHNTVWLFMFLSTNEGL